MKIFSLVLTLILTVSFESLAQYYHRPLPPPPPPYHGHPIHPLPPVVPYYPVPVVPQPYIFTCYAQGTFNGLIFYGIGYDTYIANQRALVTCQLSGQACVLVGCR